MVILSIIITVYLLIGIIFTVLGTVCCTDVQDYINRHSIIENVLNLCIFTVGYPIFLCKTFKKS